MSTSVTVVGFQRSTSRSAMPSPPPRINTLSRRFAASIAGVVR